MSEVAKFPFADPHEILPYALSRPLEALEIGRSWVQSSSDPEVVSLARQAIGIVLRDRGELSEAIRELRLALRSARRTGRQDRVDDVRATLGAALVLNGQTAGGMRHFDLAVASARGVLLARVLMRRAYVLTVIGRNPEALRDLRRALAGIRRANDVVWEARTLHHRGHIHISLGNASLAERDVRRAQILFVASGQNFEAVQTVHNRGSIAYCRGDLPAALEFYDEAATGYAALGLTWPDLAIDRAGTMLAVGLAEEAVQVVADALAQEPLQPSKRAELTLMLASAALASGDWEDAVVSAEEARRGFRRQHRKWWELHAELAAARARYSGGQRGRRMLAAAVALSDRLESARAEEAAEALLLAARCAADQRLESARALYAAAARYRRTGSSIVQATGWLAQALRHEMAGNTRGVLLSCARGLDALDVHRLTLGSSELRARATVHGQELATLALRQASNVGGPRAILWWSERWRSTALSHPPVRPPRDGSMVAELAALRDCVRRLDDARRKDSPIAALEHERGTREASIRTQLRRLRGRGDSAAPALDMQRLMSALGDTTLVEIVEIDGTIHVLVVRRNRVRRVTAGPVEEAVRAVEFARFALRQAARGRSTDLAHVGARLQAALLGDAVKMLGDGDVVVSPSSRLHTTPWPLVPALSGRSVSATPSAALWMRARAARRPRRSRMVLVAGPGLSTAGAEVAALATRHPQAVLLRDQDATVERSLEALDGASLAYVAAHGRHRPDSPMFSCLDLADGPLTVHDFEQLRAAPYRLVLSACDSGVMAAVGADEVLGLASALFSVGTAGIVSSVVEVNDQATAHVMLDVHSRVWAGDPPGDVLLRARTEAKGDLVHEATAASFVALGV